MTIAGPTPSRAAGRPTRSAFGLALAGLGLACPGHRGADPSDLEALGPPSLEVMLSACALRLDVPRACFVDGPWAVWARTDADAELSLRGATSTVTALVDGGRRWTFTRPPERPLALTVRAERGEARRERAWSIRAVPPALERVRALDPAGLGALTATVPGPGLGPPSPPLESGARADRSGDAGRAEGAEPELAAALPCVAWTQLGRARFPHRSAGRAWAQATRCFSALDASTERWRWQTPLAFLEQREGRLASALDRMDACVEAAPRGLLCRTHRALVLRDVGLLGAAVDELRQARRLAERVGRWREVRSASSMTLPLLQALGRREEARELARSLEGLRRDAEPRVQASIWTNLAWAALLEGERARPLGAKDRLLPSRRGWGDPEGLQRRANAFYEETEDAAALANGHLNLALAAVHRREPEAARRRLDSVDRGAASLEVRWWARELAARIALMSGDLPAALSDYRDLVEAQVRLPAERWRIGLGWARALDAAGRAGDALEAYLDVEGFLEEGHLQAALGQGRSGLLAQQASVIREALDLLAARGDAGAAEALVHRARARRWSDARLSAGFAQLSSEARSTWLASVGRYRTLRRRARALEPGRAGPARPLERARRDAERERLDREAERVLAAMNRAVTPTRTAALGPPAEGVLRYTVYPGRARWWGILRTASAIRLVDLGVFDATRVAPRRVWAERLLGPLGNLLADHRRLELRLHPALEALDVHALSIGGRPLIAAIEVVYAIGAPRSEDVPPGTRRAGVLVVADPTGDLDGARREGAAVAEVLAARTDHAVIHRTGVRASVDEVQDLLTRVDGFHYAGHARFSDRGLDSALVLPEGGLSMADVLGLPRGPRWVVLSGCETSRQRGEGQASDLGLAHAFLLRGAEEVLATTRQVDDDVAAALSEPLYEASDRLAAGLRAAWRTTEAPPEALAPYRVLVP